MATYVLVHGGGHGGWCWGPVARLLRARGHEVHAPTLSGLADREHLLSPGLGLDTHIADIAQLLHFEDLRDVILVGHSYGGMVITGAADRAIERVGQLVFLDAAIPRDGESLVEVSPGLLRLAGTTRIVNGVELGLWPELAAGPIYGFDDSTGAQWAKARLTAHPWKTVTDRLVLDCADGVAALPRTIVNCASSLAARPDKLRHRWSEGRVIEIDTGHSLMLLEPECVADILHALRGEGSKAQNSASTEESRVPES